MSSKFEDMYPGETRGVYEFDIETFIEGDIRKQSSEDDIRVFKYEDAILRPRHIIKINELIESFPKHTFALAKGPTCIFDGKQYEIKTVCTDTFNDLIELIKDKAHMVVDHPVILYTIYRQNFINPTTFEPKTNFVLRMVHD